MIPLMTSNAAAFHRFGLGPRPGDLESGEVRAALRQEIADRSAATLEGPGLLDSGGALAAMALGGALLLRQRRGRGRAPAPTLS